MSRYHILTPTYTGELYAIDSCADLENALNMAEWYTSQYPHDSGYDRAEVIDTQPAPGAPCCWNAVGDVLAYQEGRAAMKASELLEVQRALHIVMEAPLKPLSVSQRADLAYLLETAIRKATGKLPS